MASVITIATLPADAGQYTPTAFKVELSPSQGVKLARIKAGLVADSEIGAAASPEDVCKYFIDNAAAAG